MKNIFYIMLCTLFTFGYSFSQTITFDKTISSATQIWQTDDGGYILNCVENMYPHDWKFIKTGQLRYIECGNKISVGG